MQQQTREEVEAGLEQVLQGKERTKSFKTVICVKTSIIMRFWFLFTLYITSQYFLRQLTAYKPEHFNTSNSLYKIIYKSASATKLFFFWTLLPLILDSTEIS